MFFRFPLTLPALKSLDITLNSAKASQLDLFLMSTQLQPRSLLDCLKLTFTFYEISRGAFIEYSEFVFCLTLLTEDFSMDSLSLEEFKNGLNKVPVLSIQY